MPPSRVNLRELQAPLKTEAAVGFTNIRCEARVSVKDDGRPERAKRLLENAERYCVVLNTLRTGVNVESSFQLQTIPAEVAVGGAD